MLDGLLLSLASTLGYSSTHMVCGEGVALCGVLTLESGLGRGVYHHRNASVHGLWPQVPPYGSSQCMTPTPPRPPLQTGNSCTVFGNPSKGRV